MVNVIEKPDTKRFAKAKGRVLIGDKITQLIKNNEMKKGDVLTVAQIAGIVGAKQTSNLIPLCHNINLTSVKVDVKLDEENFCVEIVGSVECFGKTGVEMEALVAVSVAALTIYDMCKAVSHDIRIEEIYLMEKSGGKRDFQRD
jgi:molybdenum cofactor biosynthesis protein MoaC